MADESGKAADTGSAVHKAIATWHGRKDFAAAVESMKADYVKYPLADFGDAEEQFFRYTRDPRNQTAEIVLCESPVEIVLSPAKSDKTRREIVIRGTLDQVRRKCGRLFLWDVKTGNKDALTMLHVYTFQLAAYALGASAKLGEDVQPGGLIRTRTYGVRVRQPETSPDGVFIEVPWSLSDADRILNGVREIVSAVRAGSYWIGPGDHCSYCPARGIDGCVPKLIEMGVSRVKVA